MFQVLSPQLVSYSLTGLSTPKELPVSTQYSEMRAQSEAHPTVSSYSEATPYLVTLQVT